MSDQHTREGQVQRAGRLREQIETSNQAGAPSPKGRANRDLEGFGLTGRKQAPYN